MRGTVLLALVVLLAGIQAIAGERVFGKESLELGNIPGRVPTNRFIVTLHPTADIAHISHKHGVEHIRPLQGLAHTHVVEVPHSAFEHQFHLSSDILSYEREFQNYRVKRDLTFNDPSYSNQWHLRDTHGNWDLAVEGAWEMGYTGDQVLVSIVDDGLDYTHPDFKASYDSEASYDVIDHDSDPEPSTRDIHGTEAAGAATAIAGNGACGVGVAHGARVAAVRLLVGSPTDSQEAEAMAYRHDKVDVYSSSWGPYDDGRRLEGPSGVVLGAFENATKNGRNGKGSVYVWAAGNGRSSGDNCNYDGFANLRYTIAIGAVGRNGMDVYYSEPCAALVAVTPSSDMSGNFIATTSTHNSCSGSFGGTSAACPIAAGVVALCLEARPELTWRDVQNVLIHSTRQNAPNDDDWTVNGAGLHVNHKFGFGLINATKAVETALTIPLFSDEVVVNSFLLQADVPIPDRGGGSVTLVWECTEKIVVEHVDLFFDADHPRRGQLEISLTSPEGTVSVLAENRHDTNADYYFWRFMTIRNWGESSYGTWRLTVTDTSSGYTGHVNYWSVAVYGHEGNAHQGQVVVVSE